MVFIFGGIYIDLAQPPMPGLDFPLGADSPLHYADPARRLCGVHAPVEYTANTGIANGFTPYYVAAVTFSTLGFTDIAVPYNLKAQIVLLANALFGYIVFGLLLSILANVIARRAGG